MPSPKDLPSPEDLPLPDLKPAGRGYWIRCFEALATAENLLAKPHTLRRRAGDMARGCPYPDVAEAGLAKVRDALAAQRRAAAP